MIPCRNYLIGFCPLGPNCKFTHPKFFTSFDYNYLRSWNKEVNVSKCSRCDEFGHKEIQCNTEVVFDDINEYYQKYKNM